MSTPDVPKAKRSAGRARRAMGGLLSAIAVTALFVGTSLTSVVLHLDLPPTRRLVQRITNDLLGSVFLGQIIVEEIDRLNLSGVDIRSAIVRDPHGVQVIRVNGVHARTGVLALAKGALFGEGELLIDLPLIWVDDAAVLVEGGPSSSIPTIADTFILREPSKPPAPDARPIRVLLRKIELTHAWAHGALAPPRLLDADISRLSASLQVGEEGVALDVKQTGIVDRSFLPWPIVGTANYHLRLAPEVVPGTPQLKSWTSFSGHLGRIEVQVRSTMDDGHLAGTVEVPRAMPADMATLIPELPLREPISLRADLDGEIPTFSLFGKVTIAGNEEALRFEGRLDASGPTVLELDAEAKAFDPDALVELNATPVDLSGRIRMELSPALRLSADARTSAFSLAGNPIPSAEIHAVLDRGQWDGTARVEDPGLPIDASFSFSPRRGLSFVAAAEIAAIEGAPRLALPLKGAARIQLDGTLVAGVLHAKVKSVFSGLRAPGEIAVGYGGLDGHINGPIRDPKALEMDATLWGKDLQASGYAFNTLHAHAVGPVLRPRIESDLFSGLKEENGDAIHASGVLDAADQAVRDVQVRLRRDGTEVGGKIARVGATPGGLGIEGIDLEGKGIGQVKGRLVVRGGELAGKIHGDGAQLDRLFRLAGQRAPIGGLMAFDVELNPTRKGRKGHVQIEIVNGAIANVSGVSALLNVRFDDEAITTDGLIRLLSQDSASGSGADRCVGAIAQVRLDGGTGVLDGPLLDRRTWENIAGKLEVTANDWDLGCLSEIVPLSLLARALPGAGLPTEIRGKVSTRFTVERREARRFPSIRALVLRTHNVEIIGPPSQDPKKSGPAWESTEIDLQIKGLIDGETGRSEVALTLYDGALLGDVSLQSTLDLATLVDRPTQRWASLKRAPIAGRISIPRRSVSSFATLPSFVRDRIPPLSGELRIDGYLDGSVELPFAALHLSGFDLTYAPESRFDRGSWVLPINLDTLVTYDAQKLALAAHASHRDREIAAADGEITLGLDDLLAGNTSAWTGGFFARLNDAPIGEIPFFSDRDIGGHLTGTISIAGLHQQPKVVIALDAPDLRIGHELFFEEGKLSLDIAPAPGAASGDNRAIGIVKVGLKSQDGGRLDASAFGGLRWKEGLEPSLDRDATADLYAKLKGFRLAALHPFVADVLSKLDGTLDGEARIGWKRIGATERGAVQATLALHDGVFHVPQLGQELRRAEVAIESVAARVREDGSAENATIELRGLRAEGARGLITGKGSVQLDGLLFHSAEAALSIARNQEIPLMLEGVPLGMARGQLNLEVEKKGGVISGTLSLPSFHLDLPADSGRAVQALEDNPTVKILQPLALEKEARSPDALRYVIAIDLGNVEIASSVIQLALTRQPAEPLELELRDKVRITGGIALRSGKLSVLGKEFKIEQGLVRFPPKDASAWLDPLFRPETSNPYVNVRASWLGAPAGTHVYVDYVGLINPITRDKLRFSADPALSEAEVLAMLLGASDQSGSSTIASGQQSGAGPSATQLVSGVAADLAAQQFNTALSSALAGSVLQGITAQISTSESGQLRTGVAYSLTDTLRAQAVYEGGSAAAGGTGSAATSGTAAGRGARTQISLDWRFLPNWLIRSTFTFGDVTSSGLDMLWQYRY